MPFKDLIKDTIRLRRRSQNSPPHIHGRKVKPDEIRDLVEDIRKRYQLDVEIWGLRHVGERDRSVVEEKMRRSDAILQKIKGTINSWDSKDAFESKNDYEKLLEIKSRIETGGKRTWEGNPPWKDLDK